MKLRLAPINYTLYIVNYKLFCIFAALIIAYY